MSSGNSVLPEQVALTAVSGALALTATIMDDQQALEQYAAATKPKTAMPNMMEALQLKVRCGGNHIMSTHLIICSH